MSVSVANANGNTAAPAIQVPTSCSVGDVFLVHLSQNNTDVITAEPTGLTLVNNNTSTAASFPNRLYVGVVDGTTISPGTSLTWTLSATRAWSISLDARSGIDNANPILSYQTAGAVSGTVVMPTITPSAAAVLIEIASAKSNGTSITSWTVPGSWTSEAVAPSSTATTFGGSSVMASYAAGNASAGTTYGGETYAPNASPGVYVSYLVALRPSGSSGGSSAAADPVFVAAATTSISPNATFTSATGNLASTAIGDLNVLWIDVCPSAATTDPGAPTVNGVAIAAAGSTNSAGWTTVGTSYDSGSPGVRLTVIYRAFQTGDATTVTWGWSSPGNFVTGGEAWQYNTFDPSAPIPSGAAAFQTQATSIATFATPSVTTSVKGVICSIYGNRTTGTWTLPDTTRSSAYVSSGANFGASDTGTAQPAGTYTKSATFTTATSVGNAGIWLVASKPAGTNAAPTANAGADQTVEPWSTVTLSGSGTDTDGTIASYTWSQVSGPAVTLSSTGQTRTFTAPAAFTSQTAIFSLIVTDDQGATSSADTVTIAILPATEGFLSSGGWTPMNLIQL